MRRAALAIALAVAGCGWEEAEALDEKIKFLDGQLVQHRAIARNLPRYEKETAELIERVREAEAPFTDGKVAPAVAHIHELTGSSTVTHRFVDGTVVLEIVGSGGNDAAVRAIRKLREIRVLAMLAAQVTGDEWRVYVSTSAFVIDDSPAYVPGPGRRPTPPKSSIYPWVEERQQQVHAKKLELWRLRGVVGDTDRFTPKKKRLEALLDIIRLTDRERKGFDEAIEKVGAGGDMKSTF